MDHLGLGRGPRSGNGRQAGRVKGWVSEALGLGEGASVVVTELRCSEPGCPPVETALVVLGGAGGAGGTRQYKVHKPLSEVSFEDVLRATGAGGKGTAH
jgi:hypothetical protein